MLDYKKICIFINRSEQIFESVKNEHENHIPVYMNRIQFLTQKMSTCNSLEKSTIQDEIIDICKTAISKIDQTDLLRFIGEKYHDSVSDEVKKWGYFFLPIFDRDFC